MTYRPSFSDDAFYSDLSRFSSAQTGSLLQTAVDAFRTRDRETARERTIHYFRNPSRPAFFADRETLARLVTEIAARHPAWKQSLCEEVAEARTKGLLVYDAQGPPLRSGFWKKLPRHLRKKKDVLYLVRPQRFAFAPRFALGVLYGVTAASELLELLQEWVVYAASGRWEHPYFSNLDVIHRFIALHWTWALLAAREGRETSDELEFMLLKILRADARFLESRLGDSYPNNHLLADRFAAWYIGSLFPEFIPPAPEQEEQWLRELRRQMYPDGTSLEHSTHYHEVACEMFAAYVLLSRRNGHEPSREVLEHGARMLRFQVDLGGKRGTPFTIGDATEDALFPLDGCGSANAALHEIYRVVFDSEVEAVPHHVPGVERAFWLLGGSLAAPAATRPPAGLPAYPDGGFFILGDSEGTNQLLFRTGPRPGLPVLAGHMHADLLSVHLTLAGSPLVVAAGTYSYRCHRSGLLRRLEPWRAYFMGPDSCNGLSLQGEDPLGKLEGEFRALETATRVTTSCKSAIGAATWVHGKIVGETPYRDYRRGVVYVDGEYWLIYDVLPPEIDPKDATYSYQFAPGTEVLAQPETIEAKLAGHALRIVASPGLTHPRVAFGATEPPMGWVSSSYGRLTPAPRLTFRVEGARRLAALLLESKGLEGHPCRIEATMGSEDRVMFRIVSEAAVDYLILNSGSGPTEFEGIRFDGSFLWLRTVGERPARVILLGGRSVLSRELSFESGANEVNGSVEISRGMLSKAP